MFTIEVNTAMISRAMTRQQWRELQHWLRSTARLIRLELGVEGKPAPGEFQSAGSRLSGCLD